MCGDTNENVEAGGLGDTLNEEILVDPRTFLNTASKRGQVAVSLPSPAFKISTDGNCMASSAKLFSV